MRILEDGHGVASDSSPIVFHLPKKTFISIGARDRAEDLVDQMALLVAIEVAADPRFGNLSS